MLVNRKLKAIGRIVRTRTEWSDDWEVLDESKAEALDKVWHPEFYGLHTTDPEPGPSPVLPTSNSQS